QQPTVSASSALDTSSNSQWSTGICGCFDELQVCELFAYWCFPCFAYTTTSKFGECFCLPLMDILMGFTQLVGVSSMRESYHIQINGSMCDNCLVLTFCRLCASCQMSRELKTRRIFTKSN
uniref:Cornifelin n=1 Tax=Oncorhynchus kisutch TaxID=8019 RepID=A0A8C7CE17_ONCKI